MAQATMTVLLLGGAIGLAVVAIPLARYDDATRASVELDPLAVAVVTMETDLAAPTTVDLTWSEPFVVRSASDGLVSGVYVSPGEPVACGVAAFEVNARPVLAYCGPRPLSATVTSRSVGRDTDEFIAFLRTLGFFAAVEGAPTSSDMRDAIRWWQASAGAVVDATVEPADLLWVGAALTPTSIGVQAGQMIQAGDEVLTVDSRLTDGVVNLNAVDLPPDAQLVFGVLDDPGRSSVDQEGRIRHVAELERVLRARGLLAEGLPASATGAVRLAVPERLVTVPASSIVTAESGTCVFVVESTNLRSVEVLVAASSVGTVFVRSALLASGANVLVNPDRSTTC